MDQIEKNMEKKFSKYFKKGVKILAMLVLAALFVLGLGFVVKGLWNWLMPELFGLPLIGYWQAVGLFALAKLMFGFCNGGSGSKSKSKGKRKRFKNLRMCQTEEAERWKYYDEFWENEGKQALEAYVANKVQPDKNSADER